MVMYHPAFAVCFACLPLAAILFVFASIFDTGENFETYEQWADTYDRDLSKGAPAEPNHFYLKEIREDGYRLYGIS